MKRGHFLASDYDLFTDEDEFPDNGRRKKSKFGRGSGQWRFIERTPSPVEEPLQNAFEIETPSKSGDVVASNSPSLISPKSVGVRSSRENVHQDEHIDSSRISRDRSKSFGPENGQESAAIDNAPSSDTGAEMDEPHSGPKSLERRGKNGPPGSDLPTDDAVTKVPPENEIHSAQLSPSDQSKGLGRPDESSSPASVISIGSSLSSSSAYGVASEEKAASKSSDGLGIVYSSVPSDFGMDGSVFSRQRKGSSNQGAIHERVEAPEPEPAVAQDEPPLDSVGASSDHGDKAMPGADADVAKPLQPDVGLKTDQQSGQERSSMLISPSDQLESLFQSETSMSNNLEPSTVQENIVQNFVADAEAYLKTPDSKGLPPPQLPTGADQDVQPKHQDERDRAQDIEPQSEQLESEYGEMPIARKPTKTPKVGIIDLEGGEEDERQPTQGISPDSTSSAQAPTEPSRPAITGPVGSGLQTGENNLDRFVGSLTRQENTDPPLEYGGPQHILSFTSEAEEYVGVVRAHKIEGRSPATVAEQASPFSAELASQAAKAEDETFAYERTPYGEDGAVAEKKTQPFVELPATVQDSVQTTPKEQLLTPSTAQRTSFLSQPSTVSLQSVPDDDTLPTPSLTQRTSTGIVPVKSPTGPQYAPIAPKDYLSPDYVIPSSQDAKATSGPPPFSPPTPHKKPSALVEKLKAKKRKSQQSSKTQLSKGANAVSPWFAPRRSSHVVPDSEAEPGGSSSDNEEKRVTTRNLLGSLATPEKTFVKVIIRSPPEPTEIASVASSPKYLPPSQPATGGLRTNLAYFVPLAALPSHFGTLVDVLTVAISSTSVSPATSGPKDYTQSIYITDPSSQTAKNPMTTAQVFRPKKACFPHITVGDALLLRDFKVQTFQRRASLLSTETSAWAVFRPNTDVKVNGPPVEYGAEERGFARGNWTWWASLPASEQGRITAFVPHEKTARPTGKGRAKWEGINGIGVELPNSQSGKGRRQKEDGRSTQPSARKERSVGLGNRAEGEEEEEEEEKAVAKRGGFRLRNGKGRVLKSPEKEEGPAVESRKLIEHELRDGKSYVDVDEGEDEKKEEGEERDDGLRMHELRDGRTYKDRR